MLEVFGAPRDRYQFRTRTLGCAADMCSSAEHPTPEHSIDRSESADGLLHMPEASSVASASGGTCLVNESFSFSVLFPELAVLRLVILDDNAIPSSSANYFGPAADEQSAQSQSDSLGTPGLGASTFSASALLETIDFIGQVSIPLDCIRPGYRHVGLQDFDGTTLSHARLFLHVTITDLIYSIPYMPVRFVCRHLCSPLTHDYTLTSTSIFMSQRASTSTKTNATRRRKRSTATPSLCFPALTLRLEATGVKRIDELFAEAAATLSRASELRDAHYTSAMAVREQCCLQMSATLKQCVKHVAQRLSSIGASRHVRFHASSVEERSQNCSESLLQQALLSPPSLRPDDQTPTPYFNFQHADQKLLSSYKNLRIEQLNGKYIPSSLMQIVDEINALITASINLLAGFKEVNESVSVHVQVPRTTYTAIIILIRVYSYSYCVFIGV